MSSEGRNKVARSLIDLQPTAVLELFKLYVDRIDKPGVFMTFHGGSNFANNVIWQGLQYLPIPVETEGFGVFGDGTLPRPKVRVANKDKIITVLLQNNKDFKNAVLYRKKVFVKHLDDENFDGGNPFGLADPDAEISEEKYFFGQKTIENSNYVEFELNLPLDLDNFEVNQRNINAKYCYWQYRGLGCQYNGKPVERSNGEKFKDANGNIVAVDLPDNLDSKEFEYNENKSYSTGDAVYLENKNIIVNRNDLGEPIYLKSWYVCIKAHFLTKPQRPEDNPTYWQQDNCSKKISACKSRFAPTKFNNAFWSNEESEVYSYIRNVNNPEEYDNYDFDVPSTEGLMFKTDDPSFTDPQSVLTYQESSPEFTICAWIRVRSFQSDSNERCIISTTEAERTEIESSKVKFIDDENVTGFHMSYRRRDNADRIFTKTNSSVAILDQSDFFSDDLKFVYIRWNKEDQTIYFGEGLEPRSFSQQRPILSDVSNLSNNDFFGLFSDYQPEIADGHGEHSFIGDVAQVVVWERFLPDEDMLSLASLNKDSSTNSFAPVNYDNRSSIENIDDSLVSWWDMNTGVLGAGSTGILDEHGGIHLTGYGHSNFEESEITYNKITKSPFQIEDEAGGNYYLPFGGFPGTDGYDYRSRNDR